MVAVRGFERRESCCSTGVRQTSIRNADDSRQRAVLEPSARPFDAMFRDMNGEQEVRGLHRKIDALERELVTLRTRGTLAIGLLLASLVGLGTTVYVLASDAKDLASFASKNANQAANAASNATNEAKYAASQIRVHHDSLQPTPPSVQSPSPHFDPVVIPGRVQATTGDAPVAENDSCTVTVVSRNGGGNLNCQVTVRCDETVIYGGNSMGYLVCGLKDGRPNFGQDTEIESDPKLELNLEGNRVFVEDGPDRAFTVTIAL